MRILMWFGLGVAVSCALLAYGIGLPLWIPLVLFAGMFGTGFRWKKLRPGAVDKMLSGAAQVGAVKVLTVKVPGADAGKLRQMGDVLRDKDASVVAVLASLNGDKLTFLAVCGKDAVKAGVKAGDIVKHVCTVCGGSGGGKPDSAMGGGKDASKMNEALNSVADFVATKVK